MAAVVDDLDFNSDAFLNDPWPILAQLREQDPVFWSRTHQAWIITRHADILNCFRDRRLSASRIVPFLETIPGGLGEDFPLIRRFENAWITNVDDPIHSRLRKLGCRVTALRATTRRTRNSACGMKWSWCVIRWQVSRLHTRVQQRGRRMLAQPWCALIARSVTAWNPSASNWGGSKGSLLAWLDCRASNPWRPTLHRLLTR